MAKQVVTNIHHVLKYKLQTFYAKSVWTHCAKFHTHYVKLQLSEKGSASEKGGKNAKKRTTNNKIDGLIYDEDEGTIGRSERTG